MTFTFFRVFVLFFILAFPYSTIAAPKEAKKTTDKKEEDSTPIPTGPKKGRVTVKLIRSLDGKQINDLSFSSDTLDYEAKPYAGGYQTTVFLKGKFTLKDGGLLFKDEPAQIDFQKKFSHAVVIEGETTEVLASSVSATGDVTTEKIGVSFPDWKAFIKEVGAAPPKRFFIAPSLGFAMVNYTETGKTPYSSIGLVGKLSIQYLIFPPNWDFGANIFATLLPFTNTPSNKSARFIGANIRAGYILPFFKPPWKVSLLGGIFYGTMMVSDNSFGYTNLIFPQLHPTFSYTFHNRHSVYGYLKYVPLKKPIGISFSERELAGGAGYLLPLKNGHPLTFSLDYSSIAMMVDTKNELKSSSISASVGYGL